MRYILADTGRDDMIGLALIGGIPVERVTITRPRNLNGLAFDEEYLQKALRELEIEHAEFDRYETDREGIILLVKNNLPTVGTDIHTRWGNSLQRSDFLNTAKEILLPVVKKDIIIHIPLGSTASPRNDGKFHIFIWSSPQGRCDADIPETMWGIAVDDRHNGFNPSPLGIPIIEDDNFAVADIVEMNNLYIHHYLCHVGSSNEREIFKRVCLEVKAILENPDKIPLIMAEVENRRLQASRTHYIEICGHRKNSLRKTYQERVKSMQEMINSCQRQITESTREIDDSRRILASLSRKDLNNEFAYGKEFDNLIQVPGVERVVVTSRMVQVYTGMIRILYEDKVYDIGKFQIDINVSTDNREERLKITNRTKVIEGCHHPHINRNGIPCLGNISNQIYDMIGGYQLAAAVMLLLQYLGSINPEGTYSSIRNWPLTRNESR